jgi:arsenite methyltransferase
MKRLSHRVIRDNIRQVYSDIVRSGNKGCGCSLSSDSGCNTESNVADKSNIIGYSKEELSSIPEGANLELGCGNPQVLASLQSGETVVDLGSGGGFDSFLAARAVGEKGKVIGVDMTSGMISRARTNAEKVGYQNVEFRLGQIENLPVADNTADVIISNCVINLSPEKEKVFNEAYRVLKSGGRIAISDTVATADIPVHFKNDMNLYGSCISGAYTVDEIKKILRKTGFKKIKVTSGRTSKELKNKRSQGLRVENLVTSASIEAIKR